MQLKQIACVSQATTKYILLEQTNTSKGHKLVNLAYREGEHYYYDCEGLGEVGVGDDWLEINQIYEVIL